jgi:hypothetical protein
MDRPLQWILDIPILNSVYSLNCTDTDIHPRLRLLGRLPTVAISEGTLI